jgi:hypothetical protein
MNFANTFVRELDQLAGRTVEVALENSILEGVIAFACHNLLGLVESSGGYGPTLRTVYIATDAINFVRLV